MRRQLSISKVERVCEMYIQTHRTVRNLAKYFRLSKSTIGKMINDYAYKYLNYDIYQNCRLIAKENRKEVGIYGKSQNCFSEELSNLE